MLNSVSRAVVCGWNYGLALVQKMSDNFFFEDDEFFMPVQMSDGVKPANKSQTPTETPTDETRVKLNSDGKDGKPATPSVQYDTLDEVSLRPAAASLTRKAPNKGRDTPVKAGLTRAGEGRTRQKGPTDTRPGQVGNGVSDPRRYNSDKSDNSQSDLFTSKWLNNVDSSVKSDGSHKTQVLTTSDSDIFPLRSGLSNYSSESSTRPAHSLFKSSSSSQIQSTRPGSSHSSRPLMKFSGMTVAKPPSVISVSTSYGQPTSLPNFVPFNRNCCPCAGNCSKRTNHTGSSLSVADEGETPEGLSWRRLHMSRAKLKATATTSELLSGFAMVAMVELQINSPTEVPEWLFVLFAVCTTILVSVHIFALMISTYLLPNIDAVSKLQVSSLVTESPHDRMKGFIELAWAFSTILGLFLFLVEIAILCWVKFWDYSFMAAISATMIVIPVLVLFVAFAIHFYHSLVVIKCKTSVSNMQELENIKRQLDNVSPA